MDRSVAINPQNIDEVQAVKVDNAVSGINASQDNATNFRQFLVLAARDTRRLRSRQITTRIRRHCRHCDSFWIGTKELIVPVKCVHLTRPGMFSQLHSDTSWKLQTIHIKGSDQMMPSAST